MSGVHAGHHNLVGQLARDHPRLVRFGRVGWFVKGVVYLISGALALLIVAKATGWSAATDRADREASPTGALKTIAHVRGGAFVLWALAVGMLIYAAWRVVSALLPGASGPNVSGLKARVERIGFVASAIIYGTFAATAISLARSKPSNPDGNAKVSSLSGRVMAHTGGRVMIGVVGAIVIGAGLYHVIKGARVDVNDELNLSGVSARRRVWTERLGAVGEIGRGLGVALIGFFLVRAAMRYDSNQATGLDGALRRLATESWGLVIIVIVGGGFAAYGLFCLVTCTHRELQAP